MGGYMFFLLSLNVHMEHPNNHSAECLKIRHGCFIYLNPSLRVLFPRACPEFIEGLYVEIG